MSSFKYFENDIESKLAEILTITKSKQEQGKIVLHINTGEIINHWTSTGTVTVQGKPTQFFELHLKNYLLKGEKEGLVNCYKKSKNRLHQEQFLEEQQDHRLYGLETRGSNWLKRSATLE